MFQTKDSTIAVSFPLLCKQVYTSIHKSTREEYVLLTKEKLQSHESITYHTLNTMETLTLHYSMYLVVFVFAFDDMSCLALHTNTHLLTYSYFTLLSLVSIC